MSMCVRNIDRLQLGFVSIFGDVVFLLILNEKKNAKNIFCIFYMQLLTASNE